MDTASSPIRRLVSSARLAWVLGAWACLACEPQPQPQPEPEPTAAAETQPQPSAVQGDPQRAPETQPEPVAELPREVELPEALQWEPEVFGDIQVEPGTDENVCNMRLWVDPAAPTTLHGGVLPDSVDDPKIGVNLRHDPIPAAAQPAAWHRLDRQRYTVLERLDDHVLVYLDRTAWEGPIEETADALTPGDTSTVWLSTAGRERIQWGPLSVTLVTEATSAEPPRRWRATLLLETSAESKTIDLGRPQQIKAARPLADGLELHVDTIKLGQGATFDDATGELVTETPIPTVHVRVTASSSE